MFLAQKIAQEKKLAPIASDDWETAWKLLDDAHASTKYFGPDYIYAIADNKNGLVKFGKSKRPTERLKTLKTGNAMKLYLCGFCLQCPPLTEREIHRKLAPFRVSGEWFRLTPETEAMIRAIKGEA